MHYKYLTSQYLMPQICFVFALGRSEDINRGEGCNVDCTNSPQSTNMADWPGDAKARVTLIVGQTHHVMSEGPYQEGGTAFRSCPVDDLTHHHTLHLNLYLVCW